MRNIETVIWSHKKHILNPGKEYFGRNSRLSNECPLDNKCLTSNIVYKPKVSNKTNNECKKYFDASETAFKERFGIYTRDFKHKKNEKCKIPSKYIWSLKSHGIATIAEWSIVRVSSKTPGSEHLVGYGLFQYFGNWSFIILLFRNSCM